jgi:hypothetical protein
MQAGMTSNIGIANSAMILDVFSDYLLIPAHEFYYV